jgi:hypothetical protein
MKPVPMTDEHKFFYDLNGFLILPRVLPQRTLTRVKKHLVAGGKSYEGPALELLDHPSVTGILNEILSEQPLAEDYDNFRCEQSFAVVRDVTWKPKGAHNPHVAAEPQGAGPMTYRSNGGRIWSGLTRVVWELTDVEPDSGATLFLPGSHKSPFPFPASVLAPSNPHLTGYRCPAGSAVIFTDTLLHAAATAWRNEKEPRVTIFNTYNSVLAQWHKATVPEAAIGKMSKAQQSLFRGVYAHDYSIVPFEAGENRHYTETSRSV